tara:strand:+ start:332 stop:469 length:138 start_codon:yes stop_codon:yes gene_type:complete
MNQFPHNEPVLKEVPKFVPVKEEKQQANNAVLESILYDLKNLGDE